MIKIIQYWRRTCMITCKIFDRHTHHKDSVQWGSGALCYNCPSAGVPPHTDPAGRDHGPPTEGVDVLCG